MKRSIKRLLLVPVLLLSLDMYAQKTTYKDEIVPSKHSGRTTHRITFKGGKIDGYKGEVFQKNDGTWWVYNSMMKDDGPYSTEALAIKKLQERTESGEQGTEKMGAAVGAAATKKKQKIYLDNAGNKYYIENGKRVYVK